LSPVSTSRSRNRMTSCARSAWLPCASWTRCGSQTSGVTALRESGRQTFRV
jgi:hypothetical protein